MGTNYYLHFDVCPCCGNPERKLHIGKSSCGWCFGLHVIDDKWDDDAPKIRSLADWQALWNDSASEIYDEYGRAVTPQAMLGTIAERDGYSKGEKTWDKTPSGYNSWEHFHQQNYSEPGPNGLLRHRIGEHCLAHGDGTYDLIPGDFS